MWQKPKHVCLVLGFYLQLSINFYVPALGKQGKKVCMVLKSEILEYKAHCNRKQKKFETEFTLPNRWIISDTMSKAYNLW